jgi:hypothetical protein
MLRILSIFVILLFASNNTFSQNGKINYDLEESSIFEIGRKGISGIFGKDESGFYLEQIGYNKRSKSSEYSLEKYDSQLNPIESVKSPGGLFVLFQDQFLNIGFNNKDSESENVEIYLNSLDKETLQSEEKNRIIASFQNPNGLNFRNGSDPIFSKEKDKLLIHYSSDFNKSQKEEILLLVLDKNLNKEWAQRVIMPYPRRDFKIKDVLIDENGSVHVFGSLTGESLEMVTSKKGRINKIQNFEYRVLSYEKEGSEVTESKINFKNSSITNAKIAVKNTTELLCFGFYSDEGSPMVKGTFYSEINPITGDVTLQEQSDLDESFTSSQKGKLLEYDIHEIFIQEDGSSKIITEQKYDWNSTNTAVDFTSNQREVNHFEYRNILVLKYDDKGNTIWRKAVYKKQHTLGDEGMYSSFGLFEANNSLYFIYYNKLENWFSYSGKEEIDLTICAMDTNGEIMTEVLMSGTRKDMLTIPRYSVETAENELFLCFANYGVLTFKRTIMFAQLRF